jgi:hypothetical protein
MTEHVKKKKPNRFAVGDYVRYCMRDERYACGLKGRVHKVGSRYGCRVRWLSACECEAFNCFVGHTLWSSNAHLDPLADEEAAVLIMAEFGEEP